MASRALCATLAAALASQAEAIEAPSCATYGAGYNDPFRNKDPNGGLLANSLDCQHVCQKTPFCERFTFYNNSGGCWLQGSNWTEVVSPYIISGPVLCPGEVRPGAIGPFEPLDEEAKKIWKDVTEGSAAVKDKEAIGSTTINTGLPDSELGGRVVVVHDVTGARVACSPLVSLAGHLEANAFTPYPGYAGALQVSGHVKFNAPDVKTEQVMTYKLKGTDPKCGSESTTGVANACGIHIHEGTNCMDAGGHYYNHTTDTTDPWQPFQYETLAKWQSKDLLALGTPTAVATQVVNGKNFIYTFPGPPPANVTVLKNPAGILEVTDVAGLPEPEIKSREAVGGADSVEGHSNFPWWAWLLIALGIIALLGLIYYFCFMGDSKKKGGKDKARKDSLKQKRDIGNLDPEAQAEKTPLMSPAAAAAGSQAAPAAGSQVAMTSMARSLQSPVAGQPAVISSTQSPLAMPQYTSGGQPRAMSPMVMSGAQPGMSRGTFASMPVAGGMTPAQANALFDQLDRDGSGTLSIQELARLSGGR